MGQPKSLVRLFAAVFLGSLWLLLPGPTSVSSASPPAWPSPDLVSDLRDLLVDYYDQEATPSTEYQHRAPERDADKAEARKDPDTLWEYFGGPGTACHDAATHEDFVACTGQRLANTLGVQYSRGASMFDATRSYYANQDRLRMAGNFATYHAFARDFDAPEQGDYEPTGDRTPRDHKRYHERVIAGYEAHMREVLLRMFRDTRNDAQFQFDITRSAGMLAASYVPVVQMMEEYRAWAVPGERAKAWALVNGLNQRIWWEWVWTQRDGPRTAGLADLGSEGTYEAAVGDLPALVGTNAFTYGNDRIPSLRPAEQDAGPHDGLWFDADYTVPGEFWCYRTFGGDAEELEQCLGHSERQSRGGEMSPFGQYYGPVGQDPICDERAGTVTTQSCGQTNLGSIAEEWLWTFVGARMGAFLVREAVLAGDPDAPRNPIGPNRYPALDDKDEYGIITERLGYGVSGWHGGPPYHDDLEWVWHQDEDVQAIRTLSAARHDYKMQDDRHSLGETDVSPDSDGRFGDTWPTDRQEYPGGIENHAPGPSSLYGTLLFGFVLTDKVSDGLSESLYDQYHRNHIDEFNNWVWLMQATYHRCKDVDDPADDRCFAFSPDHWPRPPSVNRVPIFSRPGDDSTDLGFRYLWLNRDDVIDDQYIAGPDGTCRGRSGLPWRRGFDKHTGADAGYLLDEGGFGAYNELIQGLGGFMRLMAARHAAPPADPSEAEAHEEQQRDVLEPWYGDAHEQVEGILTLFGDAEGGYGYVPEIENSTCAGADPGDPGSDTMLTWQYGTGSSVHATTVRRAMWYSIAAMWYWWYDSGWLDVDSAVWETWTSEYLPRTESG